MRILLKQEACLQDRLEVLKMLREKSEAKVLHADAFRQRNMQFALIAFPTLFGLGFTINSIFLKIMSSFILSLVLIFFTMWDRHWHKMKHGWDHTAEHAYLIFVELTNNPNQDFELEEYDTTYENTAELFSWQPKFFYLLTGISIISLAINLVVWILSVV